MKFYDTRYFCESGQHYLLKIMAATQKNGRLICPWHHKAVRHSSNTKRYKRQTMEISK